MARWNLVIRAPEFPDRQAAERWAKLEHGHSLIAVVSVASDEIMREERAARERDRRLRLQDSEDDGA